VGHGGIHVYKPAVRLSIGHGDCLLNDGFFLLPSSGREN